MCMCVSVFQQKVDGKKAKIGSSWRGTTFKVALSNWETWMVFTSDSVTWTLKSAHELEVRSYVYRVLSIFALGGGMAPPY